MTYETRRKIPTWIVIYLAIEGPSVSVPCRLGAYLIRENSLRSPDKRVVSSGTRRSQKTAVRGGLSSSFPRCGREDPLPFFLNRLPIYPPNNGCAAQTIALSSSFRFTPLSPLSSSASRASNIPPGQKRSHSHLNLYSHVQHTRDYECVGLMKPGEGVCFCTTERQLSPLTTTAIPRVTRLSSPSLPVFWSIYAEERGEEAVMFSALTLSFSLTFSVSYCTVSGCKHRAVLYASLFFKETTPRG